MKLHARIRAVGGLAGVLWLAGVAAPAAEISVPRRELLRQSETWFGGEEARALADNIVAQQAPVGGWTNWTNEGGMLRGATAAEQAKNDHGSIDDGATTTQLRILARVIAAAEKAESRNEHERARTERHRAAFLRGVEFLFAAQYPSGGWPQHFPSTGYRRNITFNDDATFNVIALLRSVARGEESFAWVDAVRRKRADESVSKGIECILKCQVVSDGRRTGWGAQHDPETLRPAAARKFEPASLAAHETAGLVRLLMSVEQPTPEIVAAVQGAVALLEQVKLTGIRVERFETPDGRDARVVTDPAAPALWARFYELGTNRPIFAGRDGGVKYSLAEIERERRGGYGWYGDRPRELLAKDYPRWAAKWGGR